MRSPNKALCAALALFVLTGCAVAPAIVLTPPAALLAPCVAKPATLKTNADLVLHVLDLRDTLANCDDDKAALRAWSEQVKK
jgi:hypothetical protein